jgi:hypothetical protein
MVIQADDFCGLKELLGFSSRQRAALRPQLSPWE